ncbi:MAG: glutamine-hydrolyzing GMP synthase [Bacteroidetes bacterium]|nr:glutamine-hydrolyzing GMP synthase [Bacteroidota bacterium]
MQETILILDFGSQYTQLIARRVRELNVYCEIHPYNKIPEITDWIKGVILSGSPYSVREKNALIPDLSKIRPKIPVLAVCYGAQYLAQHDGGEVKASNNREYGRANLSFIDRSSNLMKGMSDGSQVWMSHGDTILNTPSTFKIVASTSDVEVAGFSIKDEKTYGIQFHPEVYHTTEGAVLLRNFVIGICGCAGSWTPESFIETTVKWLQEKIGDDQVVLGLSGGVDSTVAGVLLHRAIGKNLHCIFVNNGLLRKNEFEKVLHSYRHMHLNVKGVDASDLFLDALEGVADPEKKRKIIGKIFIDVFEAEAKKIRNILIGRHPFPGPGLAVRILGEITRERVKLLQEVDDIFIGSLHNTGLYDTVWQAFSVLLPIRSVGVMGDERTYENVVSLRAVTSTDGMTADWAQLPYDVLARISNEIINKVRGVNRVVYDISSKPPATIEWE